MIRYSEAYWKDADRVLACVPNPEKLNGRSILITGATGMIGSSVTDLLLRLNDRDDAGIRICLAGRSAERLRARFSGSEEGKDYFFVPWDAAQPAEDAQIQELKADYIVHGASHADPAVLTAEPVETMLANLAGLDSLLAACCGDRKAGREADPSGAQGDRPRGRLLYVSSSEVYGNREQPGRSGPSAGGEEVPYREEDYGYVDLLNPRSAYPCSKRAAETLCVSYGQEYGLDAVIVRPGHIYGPSITDTDSRASAQFTRNAAAGEEIVMKSAGTQLRSYCYTLDCASAILTVLLNGERGNAYNISNRDSLVTIRDVAEALAKAGGTRVVFAEATEQEKAGYNPMTNSALNAEKLERLGWKAVFGLEEGAEKTLAYYRQG